MSRSIALMYGMPFQPRTTDHAESCNCRSCKIKRAMDAPMEPIFDGPEMIPCSKCQRHIRIGEVCPWCHAEAVKAALAKKRR